MTVSFNQKSYLNVGIALPAFSVGVGQQHKNAPLDVNTEPSVTKCSIENQWAAYEVAQAFWAIYGCPNDTTGQYIYVSSDLGSLALYTIYIFTHNLAYAKTAWNFPSNPHGDDAYKAVDCRSDYVDDPYQQTKTADDNSPFWGVDLGDVYAIQEIVFTPADSSTCV